MSSVPRLGIWSWSFVGLVVATIIVTALGGFLFGIVSLLLAVPFTVIAGNAIGRLRSRGFFWVVADRAQPTVKQMLS